VRHWKEDFLSVGDDMGKGCCHSAVHYMNKRRNLGLLYIRTKKNLAPFAPIP
jgi:hypothetical protein